jgi:uncharacterized protein involved in outer membrane biogenesis
MFEWRNALSRLKNRRWLRWIAGIVAVVIILMALFALVGPPLLRGRIEQAVSAELQRPVKIGHLAFNPFTLSATVEDLAIGGMAGDPDMLDVGRIYANLQLSSLFRGGVVISALKIERPSLHVARIAENRYSFSDILERFAKKPKRPDESPTHFALYNFELSGGEVRFDDRPTKTTHAIKALDFAIPFISDVPADVAIEVQPRLSAVVDGTKLAADGQTRPFLDAPEATLDFQLDPFALAPLMAYLPVKTKLELTDGSLATKLQLKFRAPKGKAPEIGLSGHVEAAGWKLARREGGEVARFERLGVDLAELRLDARKLHLSNIEWKGVATTLQWDKDRRIGLVRLFEEELADYEPTTPEQKAANEAAKEAAKPEDAWSWQIDRFALVDGHLTLADESVTPVFKAELTPIDLEVKGLSQDLSKPAAVKFSAKGDGGEAVSAEGQLAPKPLVWDGVIDFSGVQPARSAPYLVAALPTLFIDEGEVEGHLPLKLASGESGLSTKFTGARVKVSHIVLRVKDEKEPFLKAETLEAEGVDFERVARKVSIGRLHVVDAELSAQRGRDGRIDLSALVPPAAPAPAAADETPAKKTPTKNRPAKAEPAWQYALAEAVIERSAINYADLAGKAPLKLALAPLDAKLADLSNDRSKTANFSIKAGWNKTGQFSANGQVSPEPLNASIKVDAKSLDVVAPLALFTQDYQVSVTRAQFNAHGDLKLEQPPKGGVVAAWKGDASITNMNSVDLINDTNFVRWKNFSFRQVTAKSDPLSLDVGAVALDDFQTRLILDAEGNLNLREMARGKEEGGKTAAAPPADVKSKPGKSTATLPPATPPRALPPMHVGKITLSGGDIRYSDRFVKPNLDANLLGVGGTITKLGTDPSLVAEVALKGAVDGLAPLEVSGQLAPFRQDRYLDIKASVRGYELTGLSAYAGKYVGYGIEKGKLSLDLRYQIKDRQLTAENRLFLDQLTFGDKVDSPEATTLPVRLAVSLLKNSRGEIDINLPISGTLDDPEFSFGGLVWTMIGNFFKKIVTAPFSFLAGGGGGAQGDLAFIDFPDGSSKLDADSEKKLQTVAQALIDKPDLKLEITGRAGADELQALKRETVQRKLRVLKSRQVTQSGGSVASLDDVVIPPEEYARLLENVYKDEKFDKPKNFIGLAKSLPPAEMEKLLIEHSDVTEADLPRLAQARGNVVKSWLVDKGQVPVERVFLLAPKLGPEEGKEGADAKSHGVSFTLR